MIWYERNSGLESRDMHPCEVADLELGLGVWNEYNGCVFSYIWSIAVSGSLKKGGISDI